jgi:hypothetical protein
MSGKSFAVNAARAVADHHNRPGRRILGARFVNQEKQRLGDLLTINAQHSRGVSHSGCSAHIAQQLCRELIRLNIGLQIIRRASSLSHSFGGSFYL